MLKMIEIENCKGYKLRGFLDLPEKAKEIVVMLHGFTGNRTEHNGHFRTMERKLAKLGIASLRMDYHGNGESDGEFSEFIFEDALDDSKRMVKYAKELEGIEKVYLLGFSMGGAIASLIANEDDIHNLILWSPAGNMVQLTNNRFEVCKKLENGHIYFTGFEMCQEFKESINKYDMYQNVKNYNKKVLIIQGDKDVSVFPEYSVKYNEMYKDSSLHFVKDSGHGYDTLEQMDELYSTTINFILETRK